MDINKKQTVRPAYDKVMSRINKASSSKNKTLVTRERPQSAVQLGAKQTSSKFTKSGFHELPTVLNDYVPELIKTRKKETFVVKPKRTIISLKPPESQSKIKICESSVKPRHIFARASAPSVMNPIKWSNYHIDKCFSSSSHTKLKGLQEEIKEFQDNQKMFKLRDNIFKKCGVVLDDVGHVAVDKAVQAEPSDKEPSAISSSME